jgi:serine/threonine-protein phosphatase 2A regulatory subunit B
VITSAEFHPTHCNVLAYSSSKGSIRLIDMRQSALCDRHSKLFEESEPPGTRSFFTEIIASISDIKFARGGRYILSRDYMTLKLWDINMEAAPVATFRVHEYLRPKVGDLILSVPCAHVGSCLNSVDSFVIAWFQFVWLVFHLDEASCQQCLYAGDSLGMVPFTTMISVVFLEISLELALMLMGMGLV